MIAARATASASSAHAATARATVAPRRGLVASRAFPVQLLADLAEEVERSGTVDAPIGVAVGVAVVISLAATAAIPIFLK